MHQRNPMILGATDGIYVVCISVEAPELAKPLELNARLPTVSTKEQIIPPCKSPRLLIWHFMIFT